MIVCEMKQSKLVVGLLLSGRVRKRRHGQVLAVSKRERERRYRYGTIVDATTSVHLRRACSSPKDPGEMNVCECCTFAQN